MDRRFEFKHEEPYQVGFGKPPKHAQFKKGQSGNPKGRPKKKKRSKDIPTILMDEAMAPITVKIDGRVRTTTKAKVLISQVLNKALAGDPKAVQAFLALVRHFPPPADSGQPSDRLDELMEALAMTPALPGETNEPDEG